MSCEHNQSEESYIYSLAGDCPFCDLDELRAQLADARRGHSWLSDCVAIQQRRAEEADREVAALRGGIPEAVGCLREALEDEDFQPQFSQYHHMTGPALRGCIERALGALTGQGNTDLLDLAKRVTRNFYTAAQLDDTDLESALKALADYIAALAAAPAEEEACHTCSGDGWQDEYHGPKCPDCGGTGAQPEEKNT